MKKAYVEVGNSCFCHCVTCDILKKPHPKMSIDIFRYVIKELYSNGFRKIRLAGMEPLTILSIDSYLSAVRMLRMESEMTTTLLSPNIGVINDVTIVDDLNISLSAVGKGRYKSFYKVDKWNLFDKNFRFLLKERKKPVTVVYTISKINCGFEDFKEFIRYINSMLHLKHDLHVVFFPEIRYDNPWTQDMIDYVENLFEAAALDSVRFSYEYIHDYTGKCIHQCFIPREEVYIKWNCDVYPCCLSGGEIGQPLLEELYIGNLVKDGTKHVMERCETFSTRYLDNLICDRCSNKYVNKLSKYPSEANQD